MKSAIILLCFAALASAQWPCPDAGQLAPCVCSEDVDLEINLDCSAAKTDAELKNAFTATFPFTNFNELKIMQGDCSDCSLKTLSLSTFGPVSFKVVTINGTSVRTVEGGAFGNSRGTLTKMYLIRNAITSFPFEEIGEYNQLEELHLAWNYFSDRIPPITSSSLKVLSLSHNGHKLNIDASLVRACTNIVSVYFRDGDISEVPEFSVSPVGMFTGLEEISVVDFSQNVISTLTEGTFVAENNTFSKLSVSGNRISTVYAGFVTGFGPKGYLDMSHNQISYLDEPVYRPVFGELSNSKSAQFAGNPINCGCELEWIVRTPAILDVLTDDTMCADGVTSVKSLPIEWFDANC